MRLLVVTFLTLISLVLGQAGSLDYCYGAVSICSEAHDLFTPCGQYLDQSQDTQYWQCLCGNGYVATNQACHWCAVAIDDLPDFYNGPEETSACSSISATIAPIPSSVIAAISALNATYTGSIPGPSGGGGSGGGTQQTATTPSTSGVSVTQKASTTKSVSPSSSGVPSTFFGLSTGGSTVVTIGGGGSPETTAAPLATNSGATQSSSTSAPETSSKSIGAHSWNTGVGAMLSATIFSLTVLCML